MEQRNLIQRANPTQIHQGRSANSRANAEQTRPAARPPDRPPDHRRDKTKTSHLFRRSKRNHLKNDQLFFNIRRIFSMPTLS